MTLPHVTRPEAEPPASSSKVATALSSVYLNVVAGLIVAGILLFADTTSKVLAAVAVLGVLTLVIAVIVLSTRVRKLTRRLDASNRELQAVLDQHRARLARVGVVDVTEAMVRSQWGPDGVMARARHHVKFVGIFGAKWVQDAARLDSFRGMLTRIQLNGGTVQFLLLDPSGEAAAKLAAYRNKDAASYRGFSSVAMFRKLEAEFDCFKVRLFGHFPFIRLAIADGECAVSRYVITGKAEDGLDAPQLVCSSQEPGGWSLYQPLTSLFDYLWAQAAPTSPTDFAEGPRRLPSPVPPRDSPGV